MHTYRSFRSHWLLSHWCYFGYFNSLVRALSIGSRLQKSLFCAELHSALTLLFPSYPIVGKICLSLTLGSYGLFSAGFYPSLSLKQGL